MDNAFFDEGQEAVTNLPEHLDCFRFWALVEALDLLGEVSVAELLDDVVVLAAFHDVVEADYVLGVDFLEDVDLVLEGSLEVVVLVDLIRVCLLLSLGRIFTATCSSLPSFFPRYTLP